VAGGPEKNWEELLVWTFRGRRFDEEGIELRDLENLVHLRTAIIGVAKFIWKRRTGRQRLSPNAEEALELRLMGTDRGSCVVPIFFAPTPPPPLPTQTSLLGLLGEAPAATGSPELVDVLPDAVRAVVRAVDAIQAGRALPPDFPTDVLPDLEKAVTLGVGHGDSVRISVGPRQLAAPPRAEILPIGIVREPGFATAAYTARAEQTVPREWWAPSDPTDVGGFEVALSHDIRENFSVVVQRSASTHVTVTGEVTMADVLGARGIIVVDDQEVRIDFPSSRERDVTGALHEHKSVFLRVRGTGEVDLKTNRLKKLVADDLEIISPPDPGAPSEALFERLAVDDPDRLLSLLEDAKLEPSMLTFAAEIAGRLLPSGSVTPVLLGLLEHPSPLVREGAIYGLAEHAGDAIAERIQEIAKSDPSPGVRAAAADVLEGR
jgi:hypothetical protein